MTKGQNTAVWPVFPIIQDTNQVIKFTTSLPLGDGQSWLTLRGAKMTLLKGCSRLLRNIEPITGNWSYWKGNFKNLPAGK